MYILECSDHSFYVGSTWTLETRFAQHQAGAGSEYTKCRLPVELVYAAEFERVLGKSVTCDPAVWERGSSTDD